MDPSELNSKRRQLETAASSNTRRSRYEHSVVQDSARAVFGDVNNTYYVHLEHRPNATPLPRNAENDADNPASLMKSLAFMQMDTRFETISKADARTCQWLFVKKEYKIWRDPEALQAHHGFFWIKGKPGAGKSTLMKSALRYGEESHDDLIISFFFNARGEELERSTEGMYRSLLHQLLRKVPRISDALPKPRTYTTESKWATETLKEMFEAAVLALEDTNVTCYVDALDECDNVEARAIIEAFESFGQSAIEACINFRVLLSSRHYPHISIKHCQELNLDMQEEHDTDISEYIHRHLKIGKDSLANEIRTTIQTRASGVFLWVVLVVRILNECDDSGETHLLKTRLEALPDGLGKLFEEILRRGQHERTTLLLTLRMIMFAKRPLRLEELYFAVATYSNDVGIVDPGRNSRRARTMDRFILNRSKGLLELTKGFYPTVQFIHESVKQYLWESGLATLALEVSSPERLVGLSHEHLKMCCHHYLKTSEASLLRSISDGVKGCMSEKDKRTKKLRARVNASHPFLSYALEGLVYHADCAHSTGHPQDAFVAQFPTELWRELYNLTCRSHNHRFDEEASKLHIFVFEKALKLADLDLHQSPLYSEGLFSRGCEQTTTMSLLAAIKNHDHAMLGLLLDNGAVPRDRELLSAAIETDEPAMWELLLHYGAGPADEGLLDAVCATQDLELVTVVLRHGTGVSRWALSSQLQSAISRNSTKLVKALLDAGADPSLEIEGSTALKLAVDYFALGMETVPLLLKYGPYACPQYWSVDMTYALNRSSDLLKATLLARLDNVGSALSVSDEQATIEAYGDVFIAACSEDRVHLVHFLISHGILRDLDMASNALQVAVSNQHPDIMRTLFDHGVDVNLPLNNLETALTIASTIGHVGTVQCLLDYNADVNRRSNSSRTALHAAVEAGRTQVVGLLLSAGANPNAVNPRNLSRSVLHIASTRLPSDILRLLLDHTETNVNAIDAQGDHAITIACDHGHFECVEMLLEKDIHPKYLDQAAKMAAGKLFNRKKSSLVLDMLLKKGAQLPHKITASTPNLQSTSTM